MKDNFVQTCTSCINESLGEKFYSFKTECACFSHDLQIHIDTLGYNDKEKIVEMIMYDQVYIGEDYDHDNFIKRFLFRLKNAWKCLFGDGFEIEHEFVFKGEEHLRQFQKYFNDRVNDILGNKKQYVRKTYNKKKYQKYKKEEK